MTRAAPRRTSSSTPGATRLGVALAFVAALGVAAYFVGRAKTSDPGSTGLASAPLRLELGDAIPLDTTVVVSVDLSKLRATRFGAGLLGQDRQVEGVGRLRELCGFDPLERVRELAVVVPAREDADFALIAVGELATDPIVECASKLIERRGGQPLRSSIGGFVTVRDASSIDGEGELAVRPGMLLLGGGAYLRTLVDTAEGRLPRMEQGGAHAELRGALASELTAAATIVLSAAQREMIREELSGSTNAIPRTLARVRAAALGLHLEGDELQATATILADDEASARDLLELVSSLRGEAAESPAAAMLGTADLLRRARFERRGPGVYASVEATTAELDRAGARAAELRGLAEKGLFGGGSGGPVPSAASSASLGASAATAAPPPPSSPRPGPRP
jgi:hypothetical protein